MLEATTASFEANLERFGVPFFGRGLSTALYSPFYRLKMKVFGDKKTLNFQDAKAVYRNPFAKTTLIIFDFRNASEITYIKNREKNGMHRGAFEQILH